MLNLFREIQAPGTLLAASSIHLRGNLRQFKFGCTLSERHKCAVIPIARAQAITRRLSPQTVAEIMAEQPGYDAGDGPMASIITFEEGYVNQLINEFRTISGSPGTTPFDPEEEK